MGSKKLQMCKVLMQHYFKQKGVMNQPGEIFRNILNRLPLVPEPHKFKRKQKIGVERSLASLPCILFTCSKFCGSGTKGIDRLPMSAWHLKRLTIKDV